MAVNQLPGQTVIVEESYMIGGHPRWVVSLPDNPKKLLILRYEDKLYALANKCPHGQANLSKVPLTPNGTLVCPSHGLVIDITQSSAGYTVEQTSDGFILTPKSRPELPSHKQSILASDLAGNETETRQALDDLQQANIKLQEKVLSSLENMDEMLNEVESKKAELQEKNAHLSDNNELINGITNTISELLIVTDNRGAITRINHYAELVFQCTSETLVGSSPDLLLSPTVLEQIAANLPKNSWDTRPVLYRAVYNNENLQLEIKFRNPLEHNTEETQSTFLLRGTLLYSVAEKEIGLILTATDISRIKEREFHKRQHDLEKHLKMLRSTLSMVGQGVAMFNRFAQLNIFNSNFSAMTGISSDELENSPYFDDLAKRFIPDQLESGEQPQGKALIKVSSKWIQEDKAGVILTCESHPLPEGGFVVSLRDITQSRRNQEHIKLLSTTVEQSSSEVVITDPTGLILYVNKMFTEKTGYSFNEVIGKNSRFVQSGEMSKQFYEDMWRTIRQGSSWKGEVINRKKNGDRYWQLMTITPIKDSDGAISHFLAQKLDISRQKAAESQLRYQAEHDLLTNLPNRQLFLKRLEDALEKVRGEDQHAAVLFMDLDNFKDVNDTLGHSTGDALLRMVAQRIENCLSEPNIAARLGGDEFAILMPDLKDRPEVYLLADRVIDTIRKPYMIDDHLLHIGVSMGITLAPDDGCQSSELMINSDMAMYAAKDQSGSYYQSYDMDLQKSLQRKKLIEAYFKKLTESNRNELRRVIETEFEHWAVGFVFPEEIDEINILNASFLAMHKALQSLKCTPQLILVDGNRFNPFKDIPFECVIKGDGKYSSIAAASILAKTYRDEFMQKIHNEFPAYQWRQNKGYPTAKHRDAIRLHGPCPYHRKSFQLLPSQLDLFGK